MCCAVAPYTRFSRLVRITCGLIILCTTRRPIHRAIQLVCILARRASAHYRSPCVCGCVVVIKASSVAKLDAGQPGVMLACSTSIVVRRARAQSQGTADILELIGGAVPPASALPASTMIAARMKRVSNTVVYVPSRLRGTARGGQAAAPPPRARLLAQHLDALPAPKAEVIGLVRCWPTILQCLPCVRPTTIGVVSHPTPSDVVIPPPQTGQQRLLQSEPASV